jgi:hypothetical protein
MKSLPRTFLAAVLLSAAAAQAQETETTFPDAVTAPAPAPIDLCQHRAVREAVNIEHRLRPVKEIVDIVQNPQGFALKQVDKYVIHIPPWVGYAINPVGAVRAKAMDYARKELKKQVGLGHDCAAPDSGEMEDESSGLDLDIPAAPAMNEA